MSLRVTVTDVETGETDSAVVQDGDYILIVADPCYRDSAVSYDGGRTHVVTIKGRTINPRPAPAPTAPADGGA